MAAVIEYLDRIDPEAARNARRAYGCFERFHGDAEEYARATALTPTSCEPEVVRMLATLRANAPQYLEDGRDAYFTAEQNALVAIDAERYYRAMVRGGPSSWNVRDHHMVETLDRLMKHHGPTAKAIVWEHNTHVGDARFTDMASDGMVNVGQLVRDRHGEEGVVLVGFATHRGSVIAVARVGRADGADGGAAGARRKLRGSRAPERCRGRVHALRRRAREESGDDRAARPSRHRRGVPIRRASAGETTCRRSCRIATT